MAEPEPLDSSGAVPSDASVGNPVCMDEVAAIESVKVNRQIEVQERYLYK